MEAKLTKEEFVLQAIKKLHDEKRSKGIHSRFSGFNQAFKDYFGEESRATTDKMVAEGKIEIRPAKGGVMLYLSGDCPVLPDALSKILS
jgi:hypothetical protein